MNGLRREVRSRSPRGVEETGPWGHVRSRRCGRQDLPVGAAAGADRG